MAAPATKTKEQIKKEVDEAIKEAKRLQEAWVKMAEQITAAQEEADEAARKAAGVDEDSIRAREQATELQTRQMLEFIDTTREAEEAAILAANGFDEMGNKIDEASRTGINLGKDLGLTFESAFGKAIAGGEKFSEVLKGLGRDILQVLGKELIAKPVGGFFSQLAGGLSNSLFGGASPLQLSGPFANGGRPPVGQMALVGERGPELFIPDTAGRIVPNEALGGNNVTLAPVINIDSRTDRAQVLALVDQGMRESEARILSSMNRGGTFARAAGRA